MAQVLLSRTEQERRLGICYKCPERKEVVSVSFIRVLDRCLKCGCILQGKVIFGNCPLGKW